MDPEAVPRDPSRRRTFRAWVDVAPKAPVWAARNRDVITADQFRDENHVAAKLMVNAGRWSQLAAAYDSPIGLMSLRRGLPLRIDQLSEAPVVALMLRQAGRPAEADRLLRQADALVRSVYRRSAVPVWFDAEAAAIFAVEARPDEALSMLEHAMARGWWHAGVTDLRDLAEEPAFRSLHGNQRFERIRAALDEHYKRERAETARLNL